MQRFLFILLLILEYSLASSQSIHRQNEAILRLPKIDLVYLKDGTPFDQACGRIMNKPALREDLDEAFRRLNEFQKLWDKEGLLYLRTAIQEVGAGFPYQEMQATLTVCDLGSVSSPLIISVKKFLSSTGTTASLTVFPELLFHEVMHTYAHPVYDISPLRKKYASEANAVLNHLHLMAIEKFVLTKLNRTDVFQWIDNRYRNQSGTELKRAWEIVNDIEGYEVFLKELKSMPNKAN